MPDPEPAQPAVPRPAATVVLVRAGTDGPEVLLTRRPASMAFAPDVHVFPGGAVDPGDGDRRVASRSRLSAAEAAIRLGEPADAPSVLATFGAALRELFEEAGVLLALRRGAAAGEAPRDDGVAGPGRSSADDLPAPGELAQWRARLLAGAATLGDVADGFDLELRTDLLAPLSRWVTPPFVARRFDVRFFAARLPDGIEPSFERDEVVEHRWLRPQDALAAMAAGEIGLWLPTSVTLQQLAHVESFDGIVRLGPGPPGAIRRVVEGPVVIRLVLPSAGGVSGQSVNAYLVGRRDLVAVDPGDPSEAAVDCLLEAASERGGTLRAVVISHADPDHAAGAEALAGRIGVPVYAGPGAHRVLPIDLLELGDGERLPAGDVPLVVLATPGRRPDHLALLAASDGFALTGDLVGDGPSRAILGPPDGAAWLDSLSRLAEASPGRVLPGHGEPPADVAAAIEARRAGLRA